MTVRAVLVRKGLVYAGQHRRTNFDNYIPINRRKCCVVWVLQTVESYPLVQPD